MEPCLFYSVQGFPADGLHAQQVLPDKGVLEKKPACCLEESGTSLSGQPGISSD